MRSPIAYLAGVFVGNCALIAHGRGGGRPPRERGFGRACHCGMRVARWIGDGCLNNCYRGRDREGPGAVKLECRVEEGGIGGGRVVVQGSLGQARIMSWGN